MPYILKMSRGILYYVWGDYNKGDLDKSIKSLSKFGYKYEVFVDDTKYKHFQKKFGLYKASPFDTTLFLDTDTHVLDKLDYGFEMAEKYKLACCIAPASSAYMAQPNTIKNIMHHDLPQYNTGVIFFNRETKPVFDRWEELSKNNPESKGNDQPYFSQAVYENLNPYILPKTWNFRPHVTYETKMYHGKIKVLHSNRWNLNDL